jgi:hypothetical protein
MSAVGVVCLRCPQDQKKLTLAYARQRACVWAVGAVLTYLQETARYNR